ncbi:MAG: HD domain-containing protein [Anaerolineales bacterium]|uniref:HD domain-containing protein n=1 Tax=Candidatus Desulfolinea nitratireducens TaxID=2841698 RepID=A0A8J6NQY9_9CHLR|nr:HD domain-containing protein [Candidatus Desulfolinea nitratireducens]MBL6961001.1 HD domain-containing protein [Anaerolineales bacterium]
MVNKSQPPGEENKNTHSSSYAGRWVARVNEKIIAHGGTPEQASHAAKKSRHKEIPEILYMSPAEPLVTSPLLSAVVDAIPADQPLFLIGGAVRDTLLGRVSHDLDFSLPVLGGVPGDVLKLARKVANRIGAAYYPLDAERGAARLVLLHNDGTRHILDFAAFRGDDLEGDLRGRDFTLNAIALDVHSQAIYDPLGGVADLLAKNLRLCSPASLNDDPVRILRAIRQAADFGFHILPETRAAMKEAVPALYQTSPERQRDELFRILDGKQPSTAFRALEMLDVFPAILPELSALNGCVQSSPHVDDVWSHTLTALRHLKSILNALSVQYDSSMASEFHNGLLVLRLGRYREDFAAHFGVRLTTERSLQGLLFFATLYHDVGKPLTRKTGDDGRIRFLGHEGEGAAIATERARALHMSNDEIDRLDRIIRGHLRIHSMTRQLLDEGKQPSRRAIYRFFRDTQDAGADIILLSLADLRATYGHGLPEDVWKAELDICRLLLENLWERPTEVVKPPALLNGHEVMKAFDMSPGPLVGRLLEAIREGQAVGEIEKKDEALVFGREWLAAKK